MFPPKIFQLYFSRGVKVDDARKTAVTLGIVAAQE
jgi:hypothetical protein